MPCHSQVWTNADMLEPVRASWRNDEPIRWKRVHDLPDFVQFNHSIHVAKGIGCSSCHGQVNEMPLVWQTASLQMEWCLKCHREPEKHIRPREEVFNMEWPIKRTSADATLAGFIKADEAFSAEKHGKDLVEKYGVRKDQITNCSICHY